MLFHFETGIELAPGVQGSSPIYKDAEIETAFRKKSAATGQKVVDSKRGFIVWCLSQYGTHRERLSFNHVS